jgi:adenylate cyclase
LLSTIRASMTNLLCGESRLNPQESTVVNITLISGRTLLEKRRHFVDHSNVTWEIDVYEGSLNGTVIAEIELRHENQTIELPDWIGKEVTRDPRYRKVNMLAARRSDTFKRKQ